MFGIVFGVVEELDRLFHPLLKVVTDGYDVGVALPAFPLAESNELLPLANDDVSSICSWSSKCCRIANASFCRCDIVFVECKILRRD